MVDDKKTTFDVRLLCRNCEHDWIEKVNRGIYIRYEKDNNFMINKDDPQKKRKFFVCPSCGAKKKIARLPIKGYRG